MFKKIRVALLLLVLAVVLVNAYMDKHQNWQRPITIMLYPINADGSEASAAYIQKLSTQDFQEIDSYMTAQAKTFGRRISMTYRLGAQVFVPPPPVPRDGNVLQAMLWSLKFRYYVFKNRPNDGFKPDLALFLQYYDANTHQVLRHTSTALQNGRIGVVNVFANRHKQRSNNVVIAHESLHGFGATDKYNLRNGQPIYPQGFAEPDKNPLYPQNLAELMAVHKAQSPSTYQMAKNLQETVVGPATAAEIGWIQP